MLTRRTNVLFGEEDYLLLKRLSRIRSVPVGSLVRAAVRAVYGVKQKEPSLGEKLKSIRRLMKGVKITPDEIREFINEGRKF